MRTTLSIRKAKADRLLTKLARRVHKNGKWYEERPTLEGVSQYGWFCRICGVQFAVHDLGKGATLYESEQFYRHAKTHMARIVKHGFGYVSDTGLFLGK